jgi:hypothetical protein
MAELCLLFQTDVMCVKQAEQQQQSAAAEAARSSEEEQQQHLHIFLYDGFYKTNHILVLFSRRGVLGVCCVRAKAAAAHSSPQFLTSRLRLQAARNPSLPGDAAAAPAVARSHPLRAARVVWGCAAVRFG